MESPKAERAAKLATATSNEDDLLESHPSTNNALAGHVQRNTLVFSHLERCIDEEFGDDGTVAGLTGTGAESASHSVRSIYIKNKTWWARFKALSKKAIDNTAFITFFMMLTLYALFIPDVDQLLGNKFSALALSIATTVIFVLFFFELILTSFGKKGYLLSTFFWLDVVALLSLIPDTYFVQSMLENNAFAAGRTSRLMRLIRLTARSSKVTRLNRLTRIVRVASLNIRLAALLGRGVKADDAEKLLDKKLRRIFKFLDDDDDGHIPFYMASLFVERSRGIGRAKKEPSAIVQSPGSRGRKPSIGETEEISPVLSNGSQLADATLPDQNTLLSGEGMATNQSDSSPVGQTGSLERMRITEQHSGVDGTKPRPTVASLDSFGTAAGEENLESMPYTPSGGDVGRQDSRKVTWAVAKQGAGFAARGGGVANVASDQDSLADITVGDFMTIVARDDYVHKKLLMSCKRQLRHAESMHNQTSKHSEAVGVKVALGVLLLLFVLSLVETPPVDRSTDWCLEQIDDIVIERSDTWNSTFIPDYIQYQVNIWARGVETESHEEDKRDIIYLELNRQVYCNEFVSDGQRCVGEKVENMHWKPRTSLDDILKLFKSSDVRLKDLEIIPIPEDSEDPTAFAVLNIRGQIQTDALVSLLTTLLVVFIILSGISLLTKDFTSLTKTLLNPLKELADEMQSLAHFQLAGVADDGETIYKGTSEIRNIRRAFENMKKAIKSWGKYVPWPVVQIMLQANVDDAEHLVEEREVTVFFSDIAGFTTIVETLPPEKSLLLLTRYFNDMSKAIDEYDGVIIEYIGDAILSIYGAPLKNPEHPTSGVKSTLRMLASLKKLNQWGQQQGLPEVNIRCGIHTGIMTLGNLGFRYRMKYGIVGEETSIPSKLEEMNKTYGTSVLISEGTLSKINTSMFIYRPIDFVYLYTSPEKKDICDLVYEVLDRAATGKKQRKNPLQQACLTHSEGISRYAARDFQVAATLFQKAGQLMKEHNGLEDKASAVLFGRCKAYMERPPPEGWKGAWDG